MSEYIIRTKGLSKIYKLPAETIYAVNKIDLEVKKGEFIAIMGPSGSGKTTLLDIIGCLDTVSEGTLEVLGRDVSNLKEDSLVLIRRGGIGFIFQDFLLMPGLTALENVELPVNFARIPQENDRSLELLSVLGMGHRIHHLPKQLSGGEMQRVAIARALATSPKLLLADEPTGNLDTKSAQSIFDVFKRLNEDYGLTIIVATHNDKLGSIANRTLYLRDGKAADSFGID